MLFLNQNSILTAVYFYQTDYRLIFLAQQRPNLVHVTSTSIHIKDFSGIMMNCSRGKCIQMLGKHQLNFMSLRVCGHCEPQPKYSITF